MTKYDEIVAKVERHNHLYYDLSQPEISDAEYDSLYNQLVAIEKSQGWAAHNSPSRKIGGKRGKIKHCYPLYSMNKVYSLDDVPPEFSNKTPKLDGANLTITYRRGKVFNALTRGNGEYGDSVLHLVPFIANLPQKIRYKEELVVTGECLTNNFEAEHYRNYVSGALNLKDEEEFKNRDIIFVAHDWLGSNLNYTPRIRMLMDLGFVTVLNLPENPYPTDGNVYRVEERSKELELGYTSKHPRFAVALKRREQLTAVTTLQDVKWVVGRTGTVNPVGIVTPVMVDDALISRVTLHNITIIEEHQLSLGDKIEIERAGGVIPKFLRVIEKSTHNSRISQEHAENAIGGKTKKIGPRLFVEDLKQVSGVKGLEHFIKIMEIKGLGPSSIEKMRLSHPLELYKEKNWSLLGANGEKIKLEIERSKTKPYYTVLAALGIPGVGKSVAKLLIEKIPSYSRLREDIEYTEIKGIGPKTKEQICTWLDINNSWVFDLPLQLSQETDITIPAAIKVCITGKLDTTKGDLTEKLESFGYEVIDNVTKNCNILIVAGDWTSSKCQKAERYNIPMIDYWKEQKNIWKGILSVK